MRHGFRERAVLEGRVAQCRHRAPHVGQSLSAERPGFSQGIQSPRAIAFPDGERRFDLDVDGGDIVA